MAELTCLTWNIHRCRGQDGIIDPERTADAFVGIAKENTPDLVVLTEADAECRPHNALLDLDRIHGETGLVSAHQDADLRWSEASHGFLGAVVLHGPQIEVSGGHLLDLPGHCPRGAVILEAQAASMPLRIVAAHLSLGQPLRIAQMRAIGQYLARQTPAPTLLMGDLNEWRPWGGLCFSEGVVGQKFDGPVHRSFPSARPMLPLDRIMATPPASVRDAEVLSSETLRKTSDHLPMRAQLHLS